MLNGKRATLGSQRNSIPIYDELISFVALTLDYSPTRAPNPKYNPSWTPKGISSMQS